MAWSREEVEATVADYLHMLTMHLAGQHYNKTNHRRFTTAHANRAIPGLEPQIDATISIVKRATLRSALRVKNSLYITNDGH
jgi:hypothetical protein